MNCDSFLYHVSSQNGPWDGLVGINGCPKATQSNEMPERRGREGPRAMAARACQGMSGDVIGKSLASHWQVIGEMCGKLLRDAKGLFVLSLF